MELTGFEGKLAVVTGAGRMRSIGREVAVQLARAGCDVVVTGTGKAREQMPPDEVAANWHDIDSVAEEIVGLSRRGLPVVCDVTDEVAVHRLGAVIDAEFGRVDIVVNNAGAPLGTDRRPLIELDAASWNRVIQTNLTGTFLMSREFGRRLVDQGQGGSVVNMSSIAGKLLPPNSAAYAASKAGVQAITACMAQELGRANVRVNAICPGYVETVRLDQISKNATWQSTLAAIPLGRTGSPSDIAAAVLFLCSEQGAWVTGQSWNVDGGHVVQH